MMEKEDSKNKVEVVGGFVDGKYYAIVNYKNEVFGIKENTEQQLLNSIKLAVEKRDLPGSTNNHL